MSPSSLGPLWFGAAARRKAAALAALGVAADLGAGASYFGGVGGALLTPVNLLLASIQLLEFLLAFADGEAAFLPELAETVDGAASVVVANPVPLLGEVAALVLIAYAGQAAWDRAQVLLPPRGGADAAGGSGR